jgi:hypothetical protein
MRKVTRKALVGAAVAGLVLSMVGVASAQDQLVYDGDLLDTDFNGPQLSEDRSFGNVCPGKSYPSPSASNVKLAIRNKDGAIANEKNGFQNSAVVTFATNGTPTLAGAAAGGSNGTLAGSVGTPNTVTLDSDWESKSADYRSSAVSGTITLTVPAGATAGSYNGSVPFRASGNGWNNQAQVVTVDRDNAVEVSWTVLSSSHSSCLDTDADGVIDTIDNCDATPNPDQADTDADGVGNACEPDTDGDGVIDDTDNCDAISNPGQADSDTDGEGDACEAVVTPSDTTAPTIAFTTTGDYAPTGSNGWFNTGPAKVKVTATDTSGVSALECTLDGTAVTLTNTGSDATSRWGDVELSLDGQSAVSCGATDGATPANTTATADRATHTLKLDTVSPTFGFTTTGTYAPDGNSGWFKTSPAKVKVTATDSSGVSALECTLAGTAASLTNTGSDATTQYGDVEMTTDGSRTVSCGATDGAGNTTAAPDRATHTLKLDTVSPTFGFTTTGTYAPDGNSGWFKTSPATVKVTATDETSAVSALECTLAGTAASLTNTGSDGTTRFGDVEMATDGSRTVSCGATDGAGNTTATADRATHTLKLDTINPSVDITSPAGPSTTAASVTVSGTQSDATSGVTGVTVNSNAATLGSGTFSYSPIALSCGANTITAVAIDAAGNTNSDSLELYRVCYTGTFGQPLDANGVINKAKLGRVLPVKVEIAANDNSAVTGPVYLGYYRTACTAGATSDEVETYVAAGSSNIGNTFRPADVGWIYNLDTNKLPGAAAGNCYQIDIYVGGTVTNGFATGGVAALNGTIKIQLFK